MATPQAKPTPARRAAAMATELAAALQVEAEQNQRLQQQLEEVTATAATALADLTQLTNTLEVAQSEK